MDAGAFDAETWAAELRRNRAEKDEFFAEHRQSPIPPERRDDFEGLRYFDPDPAYRVEATATRPGDPDAVELTVENGPNVRYRRVVAFEFELDDEAESLVALRQGDGGALFVPFADPTNGTETYEDGRYMEFEPDEDPEAGDTVIIDFNLAYNPFCAYSETFACPLPPAENRLAAPVRAGERDWP